MSRYMYGSSFTTISILTLIITHQITLRGHSLGIMKVISLAITITIFLAAGGPATAKIGTQRHLQKLTDEYDIEVIPHFISSSAIDSMKDGLFSDVSADENSQSDFLNFIYPNKKPITIRNRWALCLYLLRMVTSSHIKVFSDNTSS